MRNAEAVSLTRSEVLHAEVLSEDPTGTIDDFAMSSPYAVRLEKLGDRPSRDEANLHALGLVGIREPASPRDAAHLRLGEVAERKSDERELLLRQAVQEIALVLRGIA